MGLLAISQINFPFPASIAARRPSFPRKRESRTVLSYNAAVLSSHCGIPAYAGMTVEGRQQPFYTDPKSGPSGLSLSESGLARRQHRAEVAQVGFQFRGDFPLPRGG